MALIMMPYRLVWPDSVINTKAVPARVHARPPSSDANFLNITCVSFDDDDDDLTFFHWWWRPRRFPLLMGRLQMERLQMGRMVQLR